ncbi:MAG: hypothetical protein VYA41_07535, partial [Pseudomonadota bacterium]|nr:hypothetical protein [Pseudomonadota bacterium]
MASIEKLIGKSIPLVDGDTPVAEARDAPAKSKGKAAKAKVDKSGADKSGADDEKTTTAANCNEKKADGERGGRGRER